MSVRHIYGCINADGSIESGSQDFSVVPEGNGEYTIVFSAPFMQMPAVTTTQCYAGQNEGWNNFTSNGGDTRDNSVLIAVAPDRFKMHTGGGDGNTTARNWTFVAVGE